MDFLERSPRHADIWFHRLLYSELSLVRKHTRDNVAALQKTEKRKKKSHLDLEPSPRLNLKITNRKIKIKFHAAGHGSPLWEAKTIHSPIPSPPRGGTTYSWIPQLMLPLYFPGHPS